MRKKNKKPYRDILMKQFKEQKTLLDQMAADAKAEKEHGIRLFPDICKHLESAGYVWDNHWNGYIKFHNDTDNQSEDGFSVYYYSARDGLFYCYSHSYGDDYGSFDGSDVVKPHDILKA